MIKADAQLQHDVIDELRWDPAVGSAGIGVAAENGVVTLSGSIDSYAKKYAAIRATERVTGMRAIADELDVVPPTSRKRTDANSAHAAPRVINVDDELLIDI